MLNRLIFVSKKFGDNFCVPDGLMDIFKSYSSNGRIPDKRLYSKKLSYDFDYFAFTKSTKTLIAIKRLLNDKDYFFNEDCFLLVRSIFECHIMSRYVRAHIDIDTETRDVIKNFIINPLSVAYNYYTLNKTKVIDHDGKKAGIIPMPSRFLNKNDCDYYNELYPFLCQYTHCSFGALTCYFGEQLYVYDKKNFPLLTLLLVIFVFTKLFEGVVTVSGEELGNQRDEKAYYDLAYDSLELQYKLFNYLMDYYGKNNQPYINIVLEKYLGNGSYDNTNEKMIIMLKHMESSLRDKEIGSLNKNIINNEGRFRRFYPEWE